MTKNWEKFATIKKKPKALQRALQSIKVLQFCLF
jgi:hypothetical protein